MEGKSLRRLTGHWTAKGFIMTSRALVVRSPSFINIATTNAKLSILHLRRGRRFCNWLLELNFELANMLRQCENIQDLFHHHRMVNGTQDPFEQSSTDRSFHEIKRIIDVADI